MDAVDPIDSTHARCLDAREAVRAHIKVLQLRASAWKPRPFDRKEYDDYAADRASA